MPEPKYVPKHRDAPPKRIRRRTTHHLRFTGIAAWATGVTVVGGVLTQGGAIVADQPVQLQAGATQLSAAALADREQSASRSSGDRRDVLADSKRATLSDAKGVAVRNSADLTTADPRALARALMGQYGLASSEFDCVDRIWTQESKWNVHADNPHSSAYGIPQALPGSKMSSAGPDWQNSAETQIRWGLGYIKNRYGSACAAWSFKQGHGWY